MQLKKIIFIGFLILSFTSLFGLTGKQISEQGEIIVIEGILVYDGSEWFVRSNGELYALHLGPESYREEINLNLQEGKIISVKAFGREKDLTPLSINYEEKTFIFRDETGRPVWAGYGKRKNKKS
jgi:hypothetical protein